MFCRLCSTKKSCDKKFVCTREFQLKQHVNTALHDSTLKRRTNKKKAIICIEYKT